MIKKEELISIINPLKIVGDLPDVFENLTDDTREIKGGSLFFAIKGETIDGHNLIEGVKDKIACVVIEKDVPVNLPKIYVNSTREAYFKVLERLYKINLEDFTIIGITGTNGKTTFTYLIESIFKELGENVGVVGTVNYRCGAITFDAPNTTPDLKRLIPLFSKFKNFGAKNIVMEVSSHSLKQKRLVGLRFDAGVFSNLTPEHLDFHQDMEDYYKSKKLLFTEYLKKDAFGLINIDDPYGERLFLELGDKRIKTYSFKKRAGYVCKILKNDSEGLKIEIIYDNLTDIISSRLKGRFNAYNVISAYITAINLGIDKEVIKSGILSLTNVPGRLEEIRNECGLKVFVDYAHTPDALENVLKTLKEFSYGRMITVFGCGGDRDKTKRKPMGEIASKYSDLVIVTSDNPRTEEPLAIIEDIKKGIDFNKRVIIQPDREKAIYDAVYSAKRGDTILIAGKGHEDYQILGDRKIFFSDQKVAGEALRRRECLGRE